MAPKATRSGAAAVAAKAAAAAKAAQRSPFSCARPSATPEEQRGLTGKDGILRLETSGMAPVGSPDNIGSGGPQIFCIADREDDSPPTSPANFNTIPLQMSDSIEAGGLPGARQPGLTEQELQDYRDVQASFDQFKARQSEVEQAVATLLERLNRRVQVPSTEKSEYGDGDSESLGPTEDGLSFLDSRLGSRVGTPLGGNSPLGSPRDRPTLPTEGLFKRPEPSAPSGFPEPRNRFDGTAPGGSERGDLASRASKQPSEAEAESPSCKTPVSVPNSSTEATPEDPAPEARSREEAVAPPLRPPGKLQEELARSTASQLPPQPAPESPETKMAEEPCQVSAMEDGEVSETEVPAPNLAQNQVAELEEGELAESEVHCTEVADAGEVLPDSASTASSPPRQRSVAENQRLPHFGSASMCDEETDAERDGLEVAATEVPDFDGWHGWTVVATTEGRLFFFHEGMQLSQWHQPPELDPILGVWTEARDETQLTRPRFWRNDLLKISLWRDPRETSNIYQAAMDGNIFFLQLFSQVSGELDCVDHRGCSALHYAAAGGSAPSALFLLQRSAMVDRTDITLTTPLMLTCRYGFPVVLKVLLDAQANPNLADNDGQVPLHQAAELGQLDCLNLLLLCGAQAQQRNVHGETALAIAQRHRHMHCVTLLRRHRHSALDGRQHEGACASPRGLAPSFPGAPLPRKVAELQQKKAWSPNCGMQHFPGEIVQNSDAAAPWDVPYQEAGPESFVEYPSRYISSGMPEVDTSGSEEEEEQYYADNSPSFSSRSRSRQQWQQRESGEDGLLARLRRRLFPIRADLGLPNLYRFNMATQQWELPPEWEAYLPPG